MNIHRVHLPFVLNKCLIYLFAVLAKYTQMPGSATVNVQCESLLSLAILSNKVTNKWLSISLLSAICAYQSLPNGSRNETKTKRLQCFVSIEGIWYDLWDIKNSIERMHLSSIFQTAQYSSSNFFGVMHFSAGVPLYFLTILRWGILNPKEWDTECSKMRAPFFRAVSNRV